MFWILNYNTRLFDAHFGIIFLFLRRIWLCFESGISIFRNTFCGKYWREKSWNIKNVRMFYRRV